MYGFESTSEAYPKNQYTGMTKMNVPKDGMKFLCSICELTCDGAQQYKDHIKGQKHKKREARFNLLHVQPGNTTTAGIVATAAQTTTDNIYGIAESKRFDNEFEDHNEYRAMPNGHFHCSVCNVYCTGLEPFKLHMSGSRHTKNMLIVNISQMFCLDSTDRNAGPLIDDNKKNGESPLSEFLGHDFLKEERNDKGLVISYRCELCGCKMTDFAGAKDHLRGRKHKQNYKTKVDASVQVEPKSVKRTERKLQKKMESRLSKEDFWKKKDHQMAFGDESSRSDIFDGSDISFGRAFSSTDFYVSEKCKAVEVEAAHLQNLLWFTDCCENALKKVSDEFFRGDGNNEDDDDSKRALKGTMRVGILSSQQILKEDEHFRLVLIVSSRPTLSLLEKIYLSFPSHLRSIIDGHPSGEKMDFEVAMIAEEASMVVQMIDPFAASISVSITSLTIEDEDSVTDIQDPADRLNNEICLESLQQLRRAGWLQLREKYLKEGSKVIKVLRHMRHEDNIWSLISEWANEMLIVQCTFLHGSNAKAGDILRCYLELLSSGILLNGLGLIDPCEKDDVDVFGNLTTQQGEDITLFAQKCLRLVSYGQAYKVLNVQKRVRNKRKLEEADDDVVIKEKKARTEGSI